MAGEKTEKPTPKRLDEARKKGQVARSQDLNGGVVMFAGLIALGLWGSTLFSHVRDAMTTSLSHLASPEIVSGGGLTSVFTQLGRDVGLAIAPIALTCMGAGVLSNVVQNRPRLNFSALKPKPQKLNPVTGLKNLYGKNTLVELGKSLAKVSVVAAIVALTVIPQLSKLGAMVGISPMALGSSMVGSVLSLARKAAMAYLLIGVIDIVYQKRRHLKSLKMDKEEVKEEAKQQQLPSEVRGAIRRRQIANARARMMAAVPTADVVVTNPTHFSVALRYDGSLPAPEVVAKGQDLIALRIRELARDAGVPVVPDPPLARSLHRSVEVGQQIPEDLYQAVAQVLAFVYRVAARRRAHQAAMGGAAA